MRILVVTTSYPEGADGREAAGSFVADFAEELSGRANVAVVAPGREDGVDQAESLPVYRFRAPLQPLALLRPSNPGHWMTISKVLRAGRQACERAAQTLDPSHILALWALPSGYWARAVARRRGVSYSTWALGSDIWSLGGVPLVRKFLSRVLAEASVRFADGYELARDVERISGRGCEFLPSVRRLPSVARQRETSAPPYRFAFLGRWHANKGVDLLLEALSLLRERDWARIEEVRLFGGGPLETEVRAATAELVGRGRPVTLGGYLDRNQAAALYAWADYLLLPSRIESIPVLFSDAVQARCPLIATPVGDLPRLIQDHGVGILAPTATSAGILAGVQAALDRSPTDLAEALEKAAPVFSTTTAVDDFLRAIGPD